jgi:NAD(P)-dependent dehydrogenase (short-subunit alcohol dehydrogenase family)
MGSVNGKVALITGGANGIGAEVARQLHDKGARVVLTDVDEGLLKEVAARIGEDRVLTVVADVRDLSAMQNTVDMGIERFGGIDIVMANAGIGTYGSVLQVDPEAFRTLIDVNVVGVFHTVRATLPSVINRRGYVLIVSSAAAYLALRAWRRTTPRRRGRAFRQCAAVGGAPYGVDVGSAHMSWIDTPSSVNASRSVDVRENAGEPARAAGKTTSVESAARHSSRASRPQARINCPGWVGLSALDQAAAGDAVGEARL